MARAVTYRCSTCDHEVRSNRPLEGHKHARDGCLGTYYLYSSQAPKRRSGGMREGWRHIDVRPNHTDYWAKLRSEHASKTDQLQPDQSWVGLREFLGICSDPTTRFEWTDGHKHTVIAWDSSPEGEESLLIHVHSPVTKMLIDMFIACRSVTAWNQA